MDKRSKLSFFFWFTMLLMRIEPKTILLKFFTTRPNLVASKLSSLIKSLDKVKFVLLKY
jgi:hypothetical protein